MNCYFKHHTKPYHDLSALFLFQALLIVMLAVILLTGCATSSPIQRYSESKSAFGKNPVLLSNNFPADCIYRVYQRGATGFVPIESIRNEVEERAAFFCEAQGKAMLLLGEQISQPPYILGNFPRIEIVFACVDYPAGMQQFQQQIYQQNSLRQQIQQQNALNQQMLRQAIVQQYSANQLKLIQENQKSLERSAAESQRTADNLELQMVSHPFVLPPSQPIMPNIGLMSQPNLMGGLTQQQEPNLPSSADMQYSFKTGNVKFTPGGEWHEYRTAGGVTYWRLDQ